ncbi:MAG TPA: FadR family transcriptional regulator [Sphaerochaeta sp.]|nr:MAG: GntR family transcriptional regulator [Spirochaetes bacterium GWC2_52_13]PKL22535.1 MAG: FadR family transcriptional regulator [Spirochaetae bacterium HGW-Spirochaetae-4]HCJ95414.1 FadR family transcriptional regulator [Sphaerochaeta sp.]HCS37884.1 FadR family transcriptional regulator [Sphaerochaeta sp.]
MPQQTLPGRTKSARIANYLEELILSKQLTAGELLPSQQELAEKFDASSRSIREAFKQLEAKGLLSVSQGRRACVKCNNLDQFVESLTDSIIRSGSSDAKLMLDLVQVRTSVEVSAARDFSRNPRRKEVVRELRSLSDMMGKTLVGIEAHEQRSIDEFRKIEGDFHKVLVRSNDNIILDAIYENLSPLLDESLSFSAINFEEYEKKVREYQYIAEALHNGQTDLAVALVLVNLTNLKKRIEEYAERRNKFAFA